MSVDPALFDLAEPIESGLPWPRPVCPKCQTGHIGFSSPSESPREMSDEEKMYLDPDWITGTFTILGHCENPACKQAVHGTGDYHVAMSETSWREEDENLYASYYDVTHFHPALLMMPAPASAPVQLKKAILRASSVLFTDPGLAATALRATVEVFLTTQNIAATRPNGNFRTAHDRIKEWVDADPTRPQLADLFFAVKWLGNAGTHEDADLTKLQVLDGSRVLDEAFHRLFTSPGIVAHARALKEGKGSTS